MQKLIKRTAQAERVASRQLKKRKDHHLKAESWERSQTRQRISRENNALIRTARINRQVDYEAGPLAPRRDVGENAETYGTISIYNAFLPEKDPGQRPVWFHISQGDRVVVTKGRERGRIGLVKEVIKERVSVTLKDIAVVDINVPDWIQREEGDNRKIAPHPQQIPLENVKLVYPLPDPETGVPRDVIIDRLKPINRFFDKDKREWDDGDRVIPGTNTIIPWPEKGDPQYEDHEDDTLRISVEEQTFRPYLLRPPMPTSVIDELRNKYSKYRTRHDFEYVQKKEAEDEETERRKGLIKTMRTPLQELADLRQQQKKAEEKELSDEQLARIGEVIEREQAKATSAVRSLAR